MSTATLKFTDGPDGLVNLKVDFFPKITKDTTSPAQNMAAKAIQLLQEHHNKMEAEAKAKKEGL